MKRDLMLHAQWAAAPVRAASGALLYLLLVAGQALARASEPIRRKCRNRSPGTASGRACKFWVGDRNYTVMWLSATLLAVAYDQQPPCMTWCVNPCTDLKTSANLPALMDECGGCTKESGFQCYPGSPTWPTRSNPCRVIALGKGAMGRFGQSRLLHNGSAADLPPFQPDGCLPPSTQATLRSDCTDVESTARLRDRGWVVLRRLMPVHEAQRVSAAVPVSKLCTPQLRDCHYTLEEMRRLMPTFVSNLESTLASWEASGLAAASGLGNRLRLEPMGTGRPVQVTTDATFSALRAEGFRRYPSPSGGDKNFHVDSSGGDGRRGHSHRMWVVLRKEAGPAAPPIADVRDHANLCVVPTSAVDACDAPQFRAAIARHDPRPDEIFQRLACCPSLEVGDTVFYREDVVHGTQDSLVDRLGMSITLESTDPPPLAPAPPPRSSPRHRPGPPGIRQPHTARAGLSRRPRAAR